jgi:hypothetical protein
MTFGRRSPAAICFGLIFVTHFECVVLLRPGGGEEIGSRCRWLGSERSVGSLTLRNLGSAGAFVCWRSTARVWIPNLVLSLGEGQESLSYRAPAELGVARRVLGTEFRRVEHNESCPNSKGGCYMIISIFALLWVAKGKHEVDKKRRQDGLGLLGRRE